MLDMGFEPQIRTIMARVPRGYQSLMYTAACSARGAAPQAAPSLTLLRALQATWPREVRRLASEFQREPCQAPPERAER